MLGYGYDEMFLIGCDEMACTPREYSPVHQAAGFTQEEWNLLVSADAWTSAERAKVPSLLNSAVSICLRVAGLPPAPLPGAYVAAVIAKLVSPCNRLVAAFNAPESFDLMAAAGITSTSVVQPTKREQMIALVGVFSSGDFASLRNFKVDREIERVNLENQANASSKRK